MAQITGIIRVYATNGARQSRHCDVFHVYTEITGAYPLTYYITKSNQDCYHPPANTMYQVNVDLMLDQRRRRWASTKPTLERHYALVLSLDQYILGDLTDFE